MGFDYQGANGVLGAVQGAVSGVANIAAAHSTNAVNEEENARSRAFNSEQAQVAREWNQKEAVEARSWSEKMSNTAYQRSRKDMEAAGLNPILMAGQGGAGTPGASQASSGAASSSSSIPNQREPYGEVLEKAVTSSMDMSRFKREMAQRDADIGKTFFDAKTSQALAGLTQERATQTARDNIYNSDESDMQARRSEAHLRKRQADFDVGLVEADGILKRAATTLGAVTSARKGATFGAGGHGPTNRMSDDEFDRMSRRQFERKHQ